MTGREERHRLLNMMMEALSEEEKKELSEMAEAFDTGEDNWFIDAIKFGAVYGKMMEMLDKPDKAEGMRKIQEQYDQFIQQLPYEQLRSIEGSLDAVASERAVQEPAKVGSPATFVWKVSADGSTVQLHDIDMTPWAGWSTVDIWDYIYQRTE